MKTIQTILRRSLTTSFLLLFVFIVFGQDPDIEANEAEAIQEYFRTSELPGESPTRGGKRVSAPAGAMRVGCICMDNTQSGTRSTGACSGHGGVRFWLYKTVEGDTVRVLTGRHERHPHALDSVELSELVQPLQKREMRQKSNIPQVIIVQTAPPAALSPYVDLPLSAAENPWAMGWPHVAALAVACTAVVLMVRMLLVWITENSPLIQHALPDMLRPGKRPSEDENGEDADETRM